MTKNKQRVLEIKARVFDIVNEQKEYQNILQQEMQDKLQEFTASVQKEMQELQNELKDLEAK